MALSVLRIPLKVIENNVRFEYIYGVTFIEEFAHVKIFMLTTDVVEVDRDRANFIYSLESWSPYA